MSPLKIDLTKYIAPKCNGIYSKQVTQIFKSNMWKNKRNSRIKSVLFFCFLIKGGLWGIAIIEFVMI